MMEGGMEGGYRNLEERGDVVYILHTIVFGLCIIMAPGP